MGTQAAGKQTIAIGHLHTVPGTSARGFDGAGHTACPVLDILPGIAHHRGLTGGTAGGVHPHHLFHGHGKQSKGILGPQVILAGKRKFTEVGQGVEGRGCYAGGFEFLPVGSRVHVHVLQGGTQPLQLKRLQFVAGYLPYFPKG